METEPVKKQRKNYNKYTPVKKKPRVANPLLTDLDIELAARLKIFREKHIGKTLVKASQQTEIPTTTINSFENLKTKVSLDVLKAYKEKFNLNMEWAVTGEGSDVIGGTEMNTGRSLQSLITTVHTFSMQVKLFSAKLDSVIKENTDLRQEVSDLKEDMSHLLRAK